MWDPNETCQRGYRSALKTQAILPGVALLSRANSPDSVERVEKVRVFSSDTFVLRRIPSARYRAESGVLG